MVLGSVTAYHKYYVSIFNIDPVICHRTPTEGSRQTGDSCGVSNSCLVFEVRDAYGPHEF